MVTFTSEADRWNISRELCTSGRKYEIWCMGVFEYADSKKIGCQAEFSLVDAQNSNPRWPPSKSKKCHNWNEQFLNEQTLNDFFLYKLRNISVYKPLTNIKIIFYKSKMAANRFRMAGK